MLYELEIPYAYTRDKQLISPENASKGQDYHCPECENPVTWRRKHTRNGYEVRSHFAHLPDIETNCNGKQVIHTAAKNLLCNYYNRSFRIKKPAVSIKGKCHKCSEISYFITKSALSHVHYAETECEIMDGERIVDVGVFGGRDTFGTKIQQLPLLFGIELYHTSRVPKEKWDDFMEVRLPVIEVKAQDIIDYHESGWQWLIDNYENRHTARISALKLNPIQQNWSYLLPETQSAFNCPNCKGDNDVRHTPTAAQPAAQR